MAKRILDKKEIRGRLNSMRIKPEGLNIRKYGVSTKYFQGDDIKPYKRIDYGASVDLKVPFGVGEISIYKSNIFFNQHEPDLINEILAEALSRSIYPVKVYYNEKGIPSNEINNHQEIFKRWEEQKKILKDSYNSDDLDEFFKICDKKIENKRLLSKSYRFDWFWSLFFHPILLNYGDRRTLENELFLAVIPYQPPLRFSGIQSIEKIPTDYHSFKVDFESKELRAPHYFYPKNADAESIYFMSLKVNFDIDLYHHFPMHIRAYFEIYSKDWENKKIPLNKINFTMYQTNTEIYKNKSLSSDSPFITGGIIKLPPNKWGFDNFEDVENDW